MSFSVATPLRFLQRPTQWLLLLALSGLAWGQDYTGKTLVVGSEEDYPPFAIGTTDETANGFTVELWKAVAKEVGVNYTIRVRPFHQILQEFKKGKIDLLINLAQSDERRQFASFTVPHVTVQGAIFVRTGETSIRSEADLTGKTIIVLKADLAHDYAVAKGWQSQLVLVETAADGLRRLSEGHDDAMLLSKLTGLQTLAQSRITNVRALSEHAGFAQKFSFAIQKGNADLLARINEGLAITKSNGTYDALYEKWFGVYEVREPTFRDIVKYLVPLFAVIAIFGILFLNKRKTANALQASEQRFRSLVASSPVAIFQTDRLGACSYTNQRWQEIYGMSLEQSLGDGWSHNLHPDDRASVFAEWQRTVARGTEFGMEFRVIRPDGGVRYVKSHSRPILAADQSVTGFVGSIEDITDRRQAEEVQAQFAAIVTSSGDAIISETLDGMITSWNPAAEKMFGYSAHEAIGQPTAMLIPPESTDEEPRGRPRLGRGERVDHFETARLRKDGKVFAVSATVSPILDGTSNVIGLSTIMRDITEHKQAEMTLAQAYQELGVRNRELHEARDRAIDAARAKSEFLANMSHEIRTPMNVIIGMTDMVLDEDLTSEQRHLLGRVRAAAFGLLAIINDILDVSKIEAGKMEMQVVDMDLGRTIEAVADFFAPGVADKGLSLTCVMAPDLPTPVKGDPVRIRQVLVNLVGNAIKFTDTGAVTIGAEALRRTSSHVVVRISVTDTGIGIPPERHAEIFENFVQAHNGTNRAYGGTGLGLAICGQLVVLMGGRIFLESHPGKGSTFWFDLPMECPAGRAEVATRSESRPHSRA